MSRVQIAAFVGIVLLYVGVRIHGMTASCLWFDEIFSIHAAEHSWGSIVDFIALDLIHPPFFYILLKLWLAVGGDSLLWVRSLPVALSVIAIFPFIALGRELKLRAWTLIAALFLFATNGSLIKYAQEVRMYSLLLCLSLFSLWLFSRYFATGKSYLVLVIVNLFLVYTHYFGWFIVVGEVAAILMFRRTYSRRALVMMGVIGACFLPWLMAVVSASAGGSGLSQNIGWMSRPGIVALGTFILSLIEPFHFRASTTDTISNFFVTIPLLIVMFTAAAAYLSNLSRTSAHERRSVYLLGMAASGPVLLALLISWLLPYSVWGTRHLIIVFAPVSLLLGIVLTSRWPTWLSSVAAVLIVSLTGYGFVLKVTAETPRYSWCAWEPLSADTSSASNGSPIYAVEDLVAYHLWFARRSKADAVRIKKIKGIEGVEEDTAYFLPRGFSSVGMMDLSEIGDERFWLAIRGPNISESEPPLRNIIVRGYSIVDRREIKADGETAMLILLQRKPD